MADYGLLDRILHRAALQLTPVAAMSFDIDQRGVRVPEAISSAAHVFVSGLARAGTTVLMRRLYASGAFCSLTYRHMPFILAPNTLGRMIRGAARRDMRSERAHGDRIMVSIDSPESLDEVFWRVFDGANYIHRDHLLPHAADAEDAEKYVAYIAAILKADPSQRGRYLSKNNNNILRLRTIATVLPGAVFLVPFRDPLSHADSLMKQHANFLKQQTDDRFVLAYMSWLVHHEFGLDHRPFRFSDKGAATLAALDPGALDYWLELWCQTYAWLERTAPERAVFVPYEDLCEDPAVWNAIAGLCGIAAEDEEETFVISAHSADAAAAGPRFEQARALYDRLRKRSLAVLAVA